MQVMCVPDSIALGQQFNTVVRYCLQRARPHHITFDILDADLPGKPALDGQYETEYGDVQCAERTMVATIDGVSNPNPAEATLQWKFFTTPVWSSDSGATFLEPFPNMIAETGVPIDVAIGAMVNNCEPVPTRIFDRAEKDSQYIDIVAPDCLPADGPFEVTTLVTTTGPADIRVNVQVGTGGDVYLGPDDIYVAGTTTPILGAGTHSITTFFSDEQLNALPADDDDVYITALLSAPGEVFPNFIDREFHLLLTKCGAPAAAITAP
ncbi:unnamed protein product [Chrysoparadoxa australica]